MDKLNIPKTIKVGYQERGNTYTGKLAYIIYIDEKGKVRKETSWNSWRNKKIDPEDFDNEPTEGFVLNKSGGGTRESYGYNARNEFIRVYDPRGFEFEISLANLLFILQECTSTKGKGIEGEFVYGWDGTNLVLIPTCCKEYKESLKFTALKSKKIPRKEMVEGYTYQTKSMEKLIYLGRHTIRNLDNYYYTSNTSRLDSLKASPKTRKDIFYNLDRKRYNYLPGLTSIAEVIEEETHIDYAVRFTKFIGGIEVDEFKGVKLVPIQRESTNNRYGSNNFLIKTGEDSYILTKLCHYKHRQTLGKFPRYSEEDVINLHARDRTNIISSSLLDTVYKDNELFTLRYVMKSGQSIKADWYE